MAGDAESLDKIRALTASNGDFWNPACSQDGILSHLDQFLEVTDLLLEQVQLNSSHLFRADILYDTSGQLEVLAEKEAKHGLRWSPEQNGGTYPNEVEAPTFEHFEHRRTIVRRLIPRKPQLDRPLDQSCFIYGSAVTTVADRSETLVVYIPHCESSESMPWYHPKVRGLAYHFTNSLKTASATLTIHYLQFADTPSPLPDRLQRTFQSLLKTMVRLLKLPSQKAKDEHSSSIKVSVETTAVSNDITSMPLTAAHLKDTILPQHVVQNNYTRLKQIYAADLIARWVEKTEPSKHVFEDLSIAAFLIELWNSIYLSPTSFPGFVDIACGNGVLVYILIKEGWHGFGFDARRRKTWEVLGIDAYLHERICIPKPFLDRADKHELEGLTVHDGTFPRGTFIISNHADELTCWTPILAAFSSPSSPLPFLAVPCCSHALDGSRKRYTLKDVAASKSISGSTSRDCQSEESERAQPASGDLKAMRAAKQSANNHADDKSMYACLTRKTAALAQELRIDVELTLMRIPSTRNIGIVGNRRAAKANADTKHDLPSSMNGLSLEEDAESTLRKVDQLLERECASTGGVGISARAWIEKARKLQGGRGRGKVNLNGPQDEHG